MLGADDFARAGFALNLFRWSGPHVIILDFPLKQLLLHSWPITIKIDGSWSVSSQRVRDEPRLTQKLGFRCIRGEVGKTCCFKIIGENHLDRQGVVGFPHRVRIQHRLPRNLRFCWHFLGQGETQNDVFHTDG